MASATRTAVQFRIERALGTARYEQFGDWMTLGEVVTRWNALCAGLDTPSRRFNRGRERYRVIDTHGKVRWTKEVR